MHSALLSDARTGARSLVGEKQPAEVARSRQARNTRPLLTAENGIRGEARFLDQRRQTLRSGSARVPLSTHESEAVQFRCRERANSASCTTSVGRFFLRRPERIAPHFLSRSLSLGAKQMSLPELPTALLERVLLSTLFLRACTSVAMENNTKKELPLEMKAETSYSQLGLVHSACTRGEVQTAPLRRADTRPLARRRKAAGTSRPFSASEKHESAADG